MPQLIRIIYISRSTFKATRTDAVIEPNVGRILAQSRINNRRDGLVGALYFGDGCFFQCLEGEQSAIDALYARLQIDRRHKDIKLLSRESIGALSYGDWAMKFVPLEREMTRLLQAAGLQRFDPYRFDKPMVQKVMSLLRSANDPTTGTLVEDLLRKSIATPVAEKKASAAYWPVAAVGFAAAACASAVIFLLR
ncbi:MAG: hypothetical protein NVS2B4_00850 [Ramlibacter sp.]